MTAALAAQFRAGLAEGGLSGAGSGALALAVSGGGDSLAMLHLAARAGLPVQAVTVDHGLRPEAAAEAAEVGRIAATLGVPHETLHWHWDRTGNLQDAARRGRRALIANWARQRGLAAVALAHTRDDVAETFLMRLARGAGVDGLAAMSAAWDEGGVRWLRPLLSVSRADLRAFLTGIGQPWVDDPSNDNPRFDRVRARRALAALTPLGLGPGRLAEVAGHLAEARQALEAVAHRASTRVTETLGPAVRIDTTALADEPAEVQRRVLQTVLRQIAPAPYDPRGPALQALRVRLLAGGQGTLAGCRFQRMTSGLWAYREAKAVQGLVAAPDAVWDGRWRIAGPAPAGAEVRALGPGLALCPDWRATGLPRGALLSSPALWLGDTLIAAPHAGFGMGYSAIPLFPAAALHQLP